MKKICLFLTLTFLSTGFAAYNCLPSVLSMQPSDKTAGINFFEAGEFISIADVERSAAKENIYLTDEERCYVEKTFDIACEKLILEEIHPSEDHNIDGLKKNFSCNTLPGANGNANRIASNNQGGGVDCNEKPDHNFCTGGGVQPGVAGKGKTYVTNNASLTASQSLAKAHQLLNDGDDSNDPNIGYGDLLYQYADIKSPKDAIAKQEQSQQDVLVSIISCEETDISQCNKDVPEGEMILRQQNPDDALEAILYMDSQNNCQPNQPCVKSTHIGMGDLKNYYSIRIDGTTLQNELTSGGGLPEQFNEEN